MKNFPTIKSGLFYFAHPYTVQDAAGNYMLAAEDANFRLCCWRSAQLILRSYLIFSPVCHSHPIHIASPELLANSEHDAWHDFDNRVIESVIWAGIILAPGWQNSAGCVREKATFEQMGLPVLYYENIVKECEPFLLNRGTCSLTA